MSLTQVANLPPVSATRVKSLLPATHSPFFRSIYTSIYLQHIPTNRPSLNILVDKKQVFFIKLSNVRVLQHAQKAVVLSPMRIDIRHAMCRAT